MFARLALFGAGGFGRSLICPSDSARSRLIPFPVSGSLTVFEEVMLRFVKLLWGGAAAGDSALTASGFGFEAGAETADGLEDDGVFCVCACCSDFGIDGPDSFSSRRFRI